MSAKVTALGGHVVLAPHTDSHGGKIALMSDPAGALFGLLEWSIDVAGDAR
jgi:predicted enzyme related to lactoylglutathione lyase